MSSGKYREDRKREWEKAHVQRVLDYYNEHHGTNIVIVGKAEQVYPELAGQRRWDWVCRDGNTGAEIAVEITNLADELIEQIDRELWRILVQVRDEVFGRLPGVFILFADVPEKPLLLTQGRKRLFKETLKDCVCEASSKLKTKQEEDLTSQINKRMSPQVFKAPKLGLKKFDDEGSRLVVISSHAFWGSRLEGTDFDDFRSLVRQKNSQLGRAEERKAFLIIAEEGYRMAGANAIVDAFKRLAPSDYCHIDRVYRVEGSTVEHIPLPQNSFTDEK